MINRTTKLRWRRRLKRSRQQVGDISQQTEEHLEKHFFKRMSRLTNVRRFIGAWMTLCFLLIAITIYQTYSLSIYYQKLEPVPGGDYSEGVVGNFTNANPLFATSAVDSTVSKLIFPGLLKYNQRDQLVGDLAESWRSDNSGKVWIVTLKKNLKWQDNFPLTSEDVVFTYKTIQNPDSLSPLFLSWKGVNVEALNNRTVQFTLPDALSSFPTSLTNGLIPKHILGNVPVSELRSINFDTSDPIGAGPFKWTTVEVKNITSTSREIEIGLSANPLYYAGRPKLDFFTVDAFTNSNDMLTSFNNHELNGMVGLESVPNNLKNNPSINTYNIPITAEVMVFFNNSQAILSDQQVRQALVESVNESQIINGLGYPVLPVKSPLLSFQPGYNNEIVQLSTNQKNANQLLTNDGWVYGKGGIRYKNGQPLEFTLVTQNDPQYNYVAQSLVQQWAAVGVKVNVISEQSTDLQTSIADKSYDAILYGISIGTDPDVFIYWDSAQAQPNSIPGLNLSLYKSKNADIALEAGRTIINPAERAIKYKGFLQSWRKDAPALALYQPRLLYITRGKLFGFNPTMVNTDTDRLSNVANWEIQEVRVTNPI